MKKLTVTHANQEALRKNPAPICFSACRSICYNVPDLYLSERAELLVW